MNRGALLLSAVVLASCSVGVHTSGDVTVHHRVDVDAEALVDSFKKICEEAKAPDVDACAADEAKKFLDLLGGAKP